MPVDFTIPTVDTSNCSLFAVKLLIFGIKTAPYQQKNCQ